MVNALRKTNQRTVTTVSRITKRERPKSAPYLRLKNIQGTNIGVFFKNRTMPKNSDRGHSGSMNVFTNRKLQRNARG